LPSKEGTIRGYSKVALLVIDEGAYVADNVYSAVRPMLAISQGTLLAISTAWGKRGWFFEAWSSSEPWERTKVTVYQVPRFPAAFIEEERRTQGPTRFASQYECEFSDPEGTLFRAEDVLGALEDYPQWTLSQYLKIPPSPTRP
jgi:terminase large subunit-like protein